MSPPTVTVPGEHLTASSAPLTRQARGTRCHTIPPLVPLFARQRTSSGEPRGRLPHRGRGEACLGVNEAPEMFCHLSVGSGSRCQSARSPQRAKQVPLSWPSGRPTLVDSRPDQVQDPARSPAVLAQHHRAPRPSSTPCVLGTTHLRFTSTYRWRPLRSHLPVC